MSETWDMVHAERRALIDDLSDLDEAAWGEQSLCGDWTVREVAAHLVDNARTTPVRILIAMARARFDFDRQNAMGVARELGATTTDTLDGLRSVASRRSGPRTPTSSSARDQTSSARPCPSCSWPRVAAPLGPTSRDPVSPGWADGHVLTRALVGS